MFRLEKANTGALYALFEDRFIHSPYDPEREAQRFVQGRIKEEPSTVLISGAGLGYINKIIRSLYSNCKIVTLEGTSFFRDFVCQESDCYWDPSSKESLYSFLHSSIEELDLEGLVFLEWKPSLQILPSLAESISETVRSFFLELSGNIQTSGCFNKVWLKNLIDNFLSLDNYKVLTHQGTIPVLIAASGPSLNSLISIFLHKPRDYYLLALPSSFAFFRDNCLDIDLGITTDPGYYASKHLLSAPTPGEFPLAFPLTACRLPRERYFEPLIINQNNLFETELLNAAGYSSLELPSHGTVAGTALYLARQISLGRIYFAGLDLAFEDTRSHVKPHTFDLYPFLESSRIKPQYSQVYIKSRESAPERIDDLWRSSLPLKTYKEWFSSHGSIFRNHLYRINETPNSIPGIPDLGRKDFLGIMQNPVEKDLPSFATTSALSQEKRKRIALELIKSIIGELKATLMSNTSSVAEKLRDHESRSHKILASLDLPLLLEVKKSIRLQGLDIALERLSKGISRNIDFLDSLRERILNYEG